MSLDNISSWATIAASVATVVAVVVAVRQLQQLLQDRKSQARASLYGHWFDFDVLLVSDPELYELLYSDRDDAAALTPREMALAEYRLDLAELLWTEGRARGYPVDKKFWDRTLGIPLVRRALTSKGLWLSVREDFAADLRKEAEARDLLVAAVHRDSAP